MKFQFIDYNSQRNVFTAQLSGYKPEDIAQLKSSWLPGLKALVLKLASPDAENLERIDAAFAKVSTRAFEQDASAAAAMANDDSMASEAA